MTAAIATGIPLNNLFDSLTDGIIRLELIYDTTNQTIIDFRVTYHNASAKKLLDMVCLLGPNLLLLRDTPVHTNALNTLFSQCVNAVEADVPVEFDVSIDQYQRLMIQPVKADTGLLVILKAASQSTRPAPQISVSPAKRILDASLNSVVAYQAVRDENGDISDFTVLEYNELGRSIVSLPDGTYSPTLLGQQSSFRLAELFAQFVGVVETGEPFRLETTYDRYGPSDWFDVSAVKMDDGFVLTLVNITELRLATRQTERQTSLLQSILNTSLQGIVAYQAIRDSAGTIVDFRIQLVNDVAYQQGIALLSAPTVGRTLREFSPGSTTDGSFRMFTQVCETGVPFQGVQHYPVLKQWADVAIIKLDDGVLVTFKNITDTRLAEMQGHKQAELLNSILDNAMFGIISCTVQRDETGAVTDFIVQAVNQAAEAVIGGSIDELRGKSLQSIYADHEEMGLLAMYRLTVELGQPQRKEFCFATNESDLWLDVSAAPLNDGIVVTFMDITLTKQAELQREAQTVMLRDVVNGAINAILLLEAIRNSVDGSIVDFYIRSANQATLTMTGVDPTYMVNKRLTEVFPSKRASTFFDSYVRAIETGEAQRVEAYYPRDVNGLEGWFDSSAVKQGTSGVVLTLFNTTEAKKTELSRQALIAELQRSNANLEQFAYVASHDLQEPLRKVMAFGDVLQDQFAPTLGETGVNMVERMQSAAGRMQVLIKDLLAYSRVASKRDPFRLIDMSRIVGEVIVDLETVIDEKAATVTMGALPKLPGDAMQIRQLFQNLISNALKFGRPDVPPLIQIECQLVRGSDFAVVPASQSHIAFHCITIADNGIGFDQKYADRIFQVFQRLHGRSQYDGTGIGLAIVQKVVDNHKGYILAEGRPGEGTTFKILLPFDV